MEHRDLLADAEAYNFGRDQHLGHAERYARAHELARIVLGLWNSWDDDAFIRFVALVIPELQRRGLFRTAYEGRTLRENLGLRRPESRHAWRSR